MACVCGNPSSGKRATLHYGTEKDCVQCRVALEVASLRAQLTEAKRQLLIYKAGLEAVMPLAAMTDQALRDGVGKLIVAVVQGNALARQKKGDSE